MFPSAEPLSFAPPGHCRTETNVTYDLLRDQQAQPHRHPGQRINGLPLADFSVSLTALSRVAMMP